ncbi:MAG TPA: hypothetical protein VFX30_06825 [bacterium]|nr:hypothetical protein [bacterium]
MSGVPPIFRPLTLGLMPGLGASSINLPEIDPSVTSLFTPEARLSLAERFEKSLHGLHPRYAGPRYRSAPRILIEKGLSTGHFDPAFWMIDAWLSRKDRRKALASETVRTLALTHFQNEPYRIARGRAATWIGMNVILQNKEMERGGWPYLHSRGIEQFGALALSGDISRINEFWRSDGAQGGLWCYPPEAFRDESPHGTWMVIAKVPEPFTYRLKTHGLLSVAILPGPLPRHRIVAQGPREELLAALSAKYGSVEKFLATLES